MRLRRKLVLAKSFGFKRAEKTFRDRVVPAITGATHARAHVKLRKPLAICLTSIGTTTVRVVDDAFDVSSNTRRVVERVQRKIRVVGFAHRMSNHTPGKESGHGRQMQ